MRVERRTGTDTRLILTGMITNDAVCGRIAAQWDAKQGLFGSDYANLVGNWCTSFYTRYGKAPGKAIEGAFARWAARATQDKDTTTLVERLLTGLSGEYETVAKEQNPEYLIDLAQEHFDNVRARRLATKIEGHLDNGEIEEVKKAIAGWGQVELGGGAGIDVLKDTAAMEQAFADKQEPLITWPGALGEFFADAFERDSFIAFQAPEKVGKSQHLIRTAWQAMKQRRKVAFFSVGDMSQSQVMRRLAQLATRRPYYPRTIKYPTDIARAPDDPFATVVHKDKTYTNVLTWQEASTALKEVNERYVKSNEPYLKLACYPNGTISVDGIRSVIQNWERSGWSPDVCIIDYADLLQAPTGFAETRDKINETWKKLRAMSQQLHAAVITATQADAASYNVAVQRKGNFSDDKRKNAHVTGMIGINQTQAERAVGIQRLNWIVLREGAFTESKCCHIAGCLDICDPAIKSCW